jgi:hypothetical protein
VRKLKEQSLQEKLESEKQTELKQLLKQYMDENSKLKQSLTDYKNEISTMNNEREMLIQTIKKLDDRLSEKEVLNK